MYKILIVDDEQIVLDSVKFIIEKYMENSLVTETARSGREAIEKSETFRPDIVLMDIKMPGISGLSAIANIEKFHSGAIFIVITACEKFDFAKEALHLGAIDYLNKPISRNKLVDALERAIRIKETKRKELEAELELKEKMAFILPVLENGFIYSLLFSDDHSMEIASLKRILDIDACGGYIMTIESGDQRGNEGMTNKIGLSFISQKYYPLMRDAIKESCNCIIGPVMLNRIIVFVPCDSNAEEYRQRIEALKIASVIYERIKKIVCNVDFYIGVGNCYTDLKLINKSLEESLRAFGYANSSGIYHINDIPHEREFKKTYPENEEKQLLKNIPSGNVDNCLLSFDRIFEWFREEYNGNIREISSGLTELVVMIGRISKEYGIESNGSSNIEYLNEFSLIDDIILLKTWLKNRIRSVCVEIGNIRDKKLSGIIISAKEHIENNYAHEITLEDVSREVNVSPNYFSKLFKDETGNNFIDYVTALRIEKAKKLLSDSKYVNKEISYQIGYSDPNYFSRIFKKIVGVTPTEYRTSFMNNIL
jgi:Response regulator containing CheY-like receiver domain and AraC-type DNA-binding domain